MWCVSSCKNICKLSRKISFCELIQSEMHYILKISFMFNKIICRREFEKEIVVLFVETKSGFNLKWHQLKYEPHVTEICVISCKTSKDCDLPALVQAGHSLCWEVFSLIIDRELKFYSVKLWTIWTDFIAPVEESFRG